jgi:hypothetical protein
MRTMSKSRLCKFWADLATKTLQLYCKEKVESNATGLQYMAQSVSVSAGGSCSWKGMLGWEFNRVCVRVYTVVHNLRL